MTAIPLTRVRSHWRALAFVAATGLAVAGVAGAGSAGAGSPPAPPDYTYSSAVSAIGVQIALQRNPDFSSLPDPFDAELPDAEAQLDSFGTSVSDGHVINLNGAGGVGGLVCLAAPAGTCAKVPIGTVTAGLIPTFPPPDPLDAHASYPAHETGKAPLLGKQPAQAEINTSGFKLSVGSADAAADQYSTATSAAGQDLGIAGVLSVGHATAQTTQTADSDGLTTTAVTDLSNINLGGTLLHIGSMQTTTKVISRPGRPATDMTTTQLGGVTAAGIPATIDASGVHIDKSGLPGNVVSAVQKLVKQVLGKAGIKVSLATIKRADDTQGHTVAANGLMLTFDHDVKGTQPITIAPPSGVPCPPIIPPGSGLDPCSGVSFSLDGAYHGVVALGQVGVVSLAQPGGDTGPPPTTGVPSTAPGGGPAAGGETSIPPISPGSELGEPTPGSTPPVIAPGQRELADQLGGVSHRLEWFFPLFAVGLLSLFGRFRVPSRLPGAGSE